MEYLAGVQCTITAAEDDRTANQKYLDFYLYPLSASWTIKADYLRIWPGNQASQSKFGQIPAIGDLTQVSAPCL